MNKKTSTSKKPATKVVKKTTTPAVPTPGTGDTPNTNDTPPAIPPVADIESRGPGDGIDTNGDGNADFVVQAGNDGKGAKTVKAVPQKETVKSDADLISESQISEHHKAIMLTQLKENGELKPPYKDTLYQIKSAINGGSVYRPGQNGY